jgi:hypothetical protein
MRTPIIAFVAAVSLVGMARAAPTAPTCPLSRSGKDVVTSSTSCMSCHATRGRDEHPVDVDYEKARTRRSDLRAPAEVVKRGLFLPEGTVRCLTCHDPRSQLKNYLALPPGSAAAPAVDPRNPATYEQEATSQGAAPGGAAAQKTLCIVCHAMD